MLDAIKLLILFTVVSSVQAQSNTYESIEHLKEVLKNLTEVGSDHPVRPLHGGPPVTVGINVYILAITDLSEINMDFTMDMYFRQTWMDARNSFEPTPEVSRVVLSKSKDIEKFWMPDTIFANQKSAVVHNATMTNQFLRILHTGEMLSSARMTVKASCFMNFHNFPMDSQLCGLNIQSSYHSDADIQYTWNDGSHSVQISSDVSLPQFKVVGHRQHTFKESLSTGTFTRLSLEIQFKRSPGYYFMQTYIPAGLIVVISWTSFWIHRDNSTARSLIGITTILAIFVLSVSLNHYTPLPKESYIKSIDVYMGCCFQMTILSMLEYVSLNYMMNLIQKKKDSGLDGQIFGVKPGQVDNFSRVFFPVLFVCFQLTYWLIYLN